MREHVKGLSYGDESWGYRIRNLCTLHYDSIHRRLRESAMSQLDTRKEVRISKVVRRCVTVLVRRAS